MSFFEQPMCFQRKTANEICERISEIDQRISRVRVIQLKVATPNCNFRDPICIFRERSHSPSGDRQNLLALK